MAKRLTTLDWQVEFEDGAWGRHDALADPDGMPTDDATDITVQAPRRRKTILMTATGTLLIALLVSGFLLWQQAQAGYQQIQSEIEETILAEAWGAQSGDRTVATALLDPAAPARWRDHFIHQETKQIPARLSHEVTILDVTLQDDLAMVTVRVAQPDSGVDATYRTTRFYRWVEDTWQRTEPAPQFLGPVQTLETDHFIFHFRLKDRTAVEAAAVRMDAIYTDLRRDMGLSDSAMAAAAKLRIDVVLQIPASAYLHVQDNRMTVLSPLLQKIPETVSHADILAKSVIHQLVHHVMSEAQINESLPSQWALLLNGIQLWQAYAGSESLPHWQTETITWIYQDAPAIRRGERTPTAADLQLLCRNYAIWNHSLAFVPSPSALCSDRDWQRRLRYLQPSPGRLYELIYDHGSELAQQTEWTAYSLANVAAASLVEYLVDSYGRARLAELIRAMHHYQTWDKLVPAVVGVTAEEFEAGWQAYLAARHGTE